MSPAKKAPPCVPATNWADRVFASLGMTGADGKLSFSKVVLLLILGHVVFDPKNFNWPIESLIAVLAQGGKIANSYWNRTV